MSIRPEKGFTLIELMITIGILAILMSIALPSFKDFFEKKRLIALAEAVYEQMQYARSEAIARSKDVYVTFDIDDPSTDWAFGISAEAGCNPELTTPPTTAVTQSTSVACFLEIDNGDGVSTPADDYVLKRTSNADFTNVKFISQNFSDDNVKFDYVRGTAESGTIVLESANGEFEVRVITSIVGRVRMCSPSGTKNIPSYPDC